MIRIVMLGRTGNNMFQYAIGRVLAEKHGVPLVMDASWFAAKEWNQVSHFLKLPLKAEVRRSPSFVSRVFQRITGKHYWEFTGVPILRESETDQTFNADFLSAPADCMLFGYFQTPLYFEGISEKIRDEFRSLIGAGKTIDPTLAAELAAPNSVAVHIRRTDYLKIPALTVCGTSYYADAIAKLKVQLSNPLFFIFSDDPQWCEKQFPGADMKVVSKTSSSEDPLFDMHLMSLAAHHIIANSTYSWWAAWLGKNPNQKVLMPDVWTKGISNPIEEKRCEDWEIIPSKT